MSNYKPTGQQKRNHINVYFTDDDLKKVRAVQNANPEMRLDNLIVYALLKIYGKGSDKDYNAQYIQSLHKQQSSIRQDLERMEKEIEDKRRQLQEIEEKLNIVMKGDEE